ncbi:CHAP domain-containing protein [Sphaerisporangium sp. TRM90804]|uniref:CHAP domain-containing protein n=1 Tax=Sphaerisporangium sp. TRM90804 TaxID=3031113 RepID=UPI00244AE35D|nr:CHAP domain-containing protein [Sphaerisporangium sp. TRM90804]MDH2425235.1 CHAP domain-containing protein [Sphaerisporangium sp. TRM90804]
MIKLLKSQVGYSEQGGGYTKFGAWYGQTVEFDSDYSAQPWCDMFLSWAAHKLGYESWFGQFAYTVDHAKWFISRDAWGTDPEPGAVVFFDWGGGHAVDGIDHVGMVVSVDGDDVHTIEGNVDGQYVREKVRDDSTIVGYGYPAEIQAAMAPEVEFTAPPGTNVLASSTHVAASSPLEPPAGLGAGTLLVPVLAAALLVVVSVKTRQASLRLAAAVTRRTAPASRPAAPATPGPAPGRRCA